MNGYIAIFHGKRIEIRAATLWAAKQEAIRQFKPRRRRDEALISIALAELADGTPVVHKAVD